MTGIDVRSLIIGALVSLVAVLCIAAASDSAEGRYSVSMSTTGGDIYVCVADTKTGESCLGQLQRRAPASSSTLELVGAFDNLLTAKK